MEQISTQQNDGKRTISLIIKIIFTITIVISFIIFLKFGKEEKINKVPYPYQGISELIDKNTNSEILFENDEYMVVRKIPHDKNCFTQGFFVEDNDFFVESCGLYGSSMLKKYKIDNPSGKNIYQVNLESKNFAEGATRLGEYIYQLTWQEKKM
jgi:glutamine cyclotransferase